MYNVHEEEGVSMTIAVLAVQGAFAEHEKKLNERIVGVRYKQQLAISFHPELDNDNRLHQYFVQMVSSSLNKEK